VIPVKAIAGVDEAGRGPLFGPVYAAAVILDPERPIAGLRDSKQLPPARRRVLVARIKADAMAWHVAWADVEEIDSLNILGATMLAMRRAVAGLAIRPGLVQIDGNRLPSIADLCDRAETIVKGDSKIAAISAASILAKEGRDALMPAFDLAYPGYLLLDHKGYPTARHREALERLGPTPQHRRSFAPVMKSINSVKR
jgi:ribonuclease HII